MNNAKINALWEEAVYDSSRIGLDAYTSLANKILDECCRAICYRCTEEKPTRWRSGNWMHTTNRIGNFYEKCAAAGIYEKFRN